MDNLPRMEPGYNPAHSHGRMRWIDATLQAILCANVLSKMAAVLGREHDVAMLLSQADQLERLVNDEMWDEETAFYYDRHSSGEFNAMKHIGAYWALVAGVVPDERLERFIAHLDNPNEFNRPHRVPALSADHTAYQANGAYWCGGVWAPTNYMVMKGLRACGYGSLAHLIARNHLDNVVQVFEDTGTVWENYAPEMPQPGKPAKPDFVGWTGLPAIAVLFEEVFGLQPDVPNGTLLWDVRLMDEFGVEQYPFGPDVLLDLRCEARESSLDEPEITVHTNRPLTIKLHWAGGEKTLQF
jgi:glycogen debranching enzyme